MKETEEEGEEVYLEPIYNKTVVGFIEKYSGLNSDLDFYSDFEELGEAEKDVLKFLAFGNIYNLYGDNCWSNPAIDIMNNDLYEKIRECFEPKPPVFK